MNKIAEKYDQLDNGQCKSEKFICIFTLTHLYMSK